MKRVETLAAAKVNLSLVVRARRPDGLHPVFGRFQSVDWYDHLVVDPGAEPGIEGRDGRPVIDGERNLAWRAALAAAGVLGVDPPAVHLDKQIAVAAGLGGGSADAAAVLAAMACAASRKLSDVASVAPRLGSDVPFCLVGGSADVSGVGDIVVPTTGGADFALALVVPPIEVPTAEVYAAWDRLGGPEDAAVVTGALPPSLRELAVVRNDLAPAALSVAPDIAEWRSELASAWDRPVLVSGSGPSLFAFFLDRDEAEAALDVAPRGARHVAACVPVDHGWAVMYDGAEANEELAPRAPEGDEWYTLRGGVLTTSFR